MATYSVHQSVRNAAHVGLPAHSRNAETIQDSYRSLPMTTKMRNNFVGGATALSLAFAVMHPIDTLKTQMQAQPISKGVSTGAAATFRTAAAGVWRAATSGTAVKGGGASALYLRGFFSSVLGAAPQGGTRLATYELTKEHLVGLGSQVEAESQGKKAVSTSTAATVAVLSSPFLVSAMSAVTGDLMSSTVKVPREVITQRIQTGMYKNTAHAVRTILSHEGPQGNVGKAKGFFGWVGGRSCFRSCLVVPAVATSLTPLLTALFTGYLSTTLRDIPFMIILFASYEMLKLEASKKARQQDVGEGALPHTEHKISTTLSTLFGGLSGGLAGWITTPMDVAKTRIMTTPKEHGRLTISSVMRQVYSEAGTRGLFIGAVPRAGWWFCVCSIFFPTYERTKAFMNQFDGS